jgi:hypothetical protein
MIGATKAVLARAVFALLAFHLGLFPEAFIGKVGAAQAMLALLVFAPCALDVSLGERRHQLARREHQNIARVIRLITRSPQ